MVIMSDRAYVALLALVLVLELCRHRIYTIMTATRHILDLVGAVDDLIDFSSLFLSNYFFFHN